MLAELEDMAVIDQIGVEIELDNDVLSFTDTTLTRERSIERQRSYPDPAEDIGDETFGVEIELDPESLSFAEQAEEEEPDDKIDHIICASASVGTEVFSLITGQGKEDATPQTADQNSIEQPEDDTIFEKPARRRKRLPMTVVEIGKRAMRSVGQRHTLPTAKRQLLTRATCHLKSMVKRSRAPPVSPTARKALAAFDDGDKKKDDATCALTHASLASSSTLGASWCPSSITVSTCDFAPGMNRRAVLERHRNTNAWEAARKGDYALLSYIVESEDAAILMQEDGEGHVPLYYAATSYGREDGLSFGKYGLESVKLLVDAWPDDTELPRALVRQCEMRNSLIHRDVLEVLSRELSRRERGKRRSRYPLSILWARKEKEEVEIDGLRDVVPVSFYEDLGDDGFAEDY